MIPVPESSSYYLALGGLAGLFGAWLAAVTMLFLAGVVGMARRRPRARLALAIGAILFLGPVVLIGVLLL